MRMGSLTEAAIRDALTALTTHDAALAEKIIVNDRNINAMQHEVISVITTTIAIAITIILLPREKRGIGVAIPITSIMIAPVTAASIMAAIVLIAILLVPVVMIAPEMAVVIPLISAADTRLVPEEPVRRPIAPVNGTIEVVVERVVPDARIRRAVRRIAGIAGAVLVVAVTVVAVIAVAVPVIIDRRARAQTDEGRRNGGKCEELFHMNSFAGEPERHATAGA